MTDERGIKKEKRTIKRSTDRKTMIKARRKQGTKVCEKEKNEGGQANFGKYVSEKEKDE